MSLPQVADKQPVEAGMFLRGGCGLHSTGGRVPHRRNLSFLAARALIGADILYFLPKVGLGDAASVA